MTKYTLFTLFLVFMTTQICAQNTPSLHIKKIAEKITLDGKLDEATWQTAEQTSPFLQSIPYDTSVANAKTEVKLAFD
jgi:hypothetical protein